MKTASEMQKVITALAQKHDFNLNQSGCSLVLQLPGFMPLVIERITLNEVSVCHYYQQNGDMMRDPEVVFFTGYFFTGDKQWVPISFEQLPGTYQVAATLTDDHKAIEKVAPRQQADLASFCRMWARNLKHQGWLEHGIRKESAFTD